MRLARNEHETKGDRRWIGMLPAIMMMSAIVLLSHQEKPPSLGNDPQLSAVAGHVLGYGVLALTLLFGFRWAGMRFSSAAYLAMLVSMAFSVTDELHQRFVPGRHADPWDLLADTIGAAVAVGFVALWRHYRTRPV